MKVYVAERLIDYEGFQIIEICTTREIAQDACNDNERYCNGYDIEEYELRDE